MGTIVLRRLMIFVKMFVVRYFFIFYLFIYFFFKFSLWGPFGFDLLFCRLWKKLI